MNKKNKTDDDEIEIKVIMRKPFSKLDKAEIRDRIIGIDKDVFVKRN